MPSPPPQPVPTRTTRSSNPHNAPSGAGGGHRTGASPMSYGAMTGISFTNGGGFSFEGKPRSVKWGNAGMVGSFGARFYGDMGGDSPIIPFSTSISMEPSSFAASAHAFNLGSMSSSYQRRSYAAALTGRENLSNSFASMSFQPMSLGTSYNRHQVQGMMARTDAELTKAYDCCGHTHSGLHSLLEHVEDCHPFSDPNMPDDEFSPVTNAMDLDLEEVEEEPSQAATSGSSQTSISPHSTTAVPVPSYPLPTKGPLPVPATADSVGKSPLKLSDVLKSPTDASPQMRPSNLTLTRTQSSSSSPPEGSVATPTTSAQPSPVFPQPKMNSARPANSGFFGGNAMRPAVQQKRFDRAFNEVVAGKKEDMPKNDMPTAVAPGVLFASAVSSLGLPTNPPGSKSNPVTPKETNPELKAPSAASTPGGTAPTLAPATAAGVQTKPAQSGETTTQSPAQAQGQNKLFTDPMPQPSLFSSHKPWRCPNPGCNKAYKQSNGLKYHQQKGQCDFAIHDALDLGLTVEEAEERNRPFVCAVGAGCAKRYRQMNGLKYHYLNSGDHGLYGLKMLQNGTHPHPPSLPPPPSRTTAPTPISTAPRPSGAPNPSGIHTRPGGAVSGTHPSRPGGAPYTIPSHAAAAGNAQPQGRVVGQGPGPHHGHGHGPGPGHPHPHHGAPHGHQMPRMGTFPTRPGGVGVHRPGGPGGPGPRPVQQQKPPQPQPQPVTKGRDAVLFSAVGEDPMDIMSRMDS